MKAVFGLGNPGIEYALTRHNVGFSVIDLYRKAHCHGEKGRILSSSLVYQTENLLLIKPMTYMNASGEAVSAIIDRFKLAFPDVLIIYDDLDLPLGRMRILPKGGAGTQKGMLSILEVLGTEAIPRLRIGIGMESRSQDTIDYVLGRFMPREWEELIPILERSVDAIEAFRTQDIDTVMTRFNQRGPAVVNDGGDTIL
ncbi:aminoacyl-tRNA hydrolase [Candidatus Bipolaricaulota bacterium]|nr:aminoacyl-tRNA hydrolase [Candidatus Bipolaricaulota bacterium]